MAAARRSSGRLQLGALLAMGLACLHCAAFVGSMKNAAAARPQPTIMSAA
eukprot:CAMPEP_0197646186 /NCGR_PEP_ID=MMETSP1338-20131121/22207_1 /TAXON_ID=43686 ORGANISM="Pelagodinium beii, Strain RCC1491" /NCGR_SAMPLE_ID=MMETSP1338 /ASSEMBLY_ACC=CAM_ASM_000754 /LENGTH=49 /DNA_ID= /DNA_START= /DNA_END= /DNA_ORIENTATION=